MLWSGAVIQAEHIAKHITTDQFTPTVNSPLLPEDLLVKRESFTILGYEVYQLLVGSIPWMPGVWLFFTGGYIHCGM